MAGSITQTLLPVGSITNTHPNNEEITLLWVGDAADGTIPTLLIDQYAGWYIARAATVPGAVASGGVVPTDQYDITAIDPDGIDLFDGALMNRSSTVPQAEPMSALIPFGGITITFAGQAVHSATGKLKIYLVR